MPGHTSHHLNEMILHQEPRTAKKQGCGISLPYETRLEMGLMLDEHLCALNVALNQYTKHHWLTEGAESFGWMTHLLDNNGDMASKRHLNNNLN